MHASADEGVSDHANSGGGVLELRQVGHAGEEPVTTLGQAVGQLAAPLNQEADIEVPAGHGGRSVHAVKLAPRVDAAGSCIFGNGVGEEDAVHVQQEAAGWSLDPPLELGRAVELQPRLEAVLLVPVAGLDGLVEQAVEACGVRVQLRLGSATDRRGEQHQAG